MRSKPSSYGLAWLIILLGLVSSCVLAADDKTGWSDTAEFSYVLTAGNSETNTFGFKNTLGYAWERSSFTFRVGGIRAASTTRTWYAIGTGPDDYTVIETSQTSKTAENYFINGRYDRKITERFFWYAGGGWERNRFAGIENRYSLQGGVGNIWFDREDLKFRTDYALTYNNQKDVVELPGTDNSNAGVRGSWDFLYKIWETTTYHNVVIMDENLQKGSDFRADITNSLAVAMNKHLALKVSLQWVFINDPAYTEVPLYSLPPVDPNAVLVGLVPQQLDKLDTFFTASLVVNF